MRVFAHQARQQQSPPVCLYLHYSLYLVQSMNQVEREKRIEEKGWLRKPHSNLGVYIGTPPELGPEWVGGQIMRSPEGSG